MGGVQATKDPSHLFGFNGDPALVQAVRRAWPRPSPEADELLRTLEETLAINRLWQERQGWASNRRRVDFMRANFLRRWKEAQSRGAPPKVFFKFGSGHMLRGLSLTDVFDLGALVPEVAAIGGGHSFHLLVVGGPGGQHAQFNPVEWGYAPAPAGGIEEHKLGSVAQVFPQGLTLVDLRPLRPIVSSRRAEAAPRFLAKTIHGFDAVLFIPDARPSSGL